VGGTGEVEKGVFDCIQVNLFVIGECGLRGRVCKCCRAREDISIGHLGDNVVDPLMTDE